jgi:hypothetical protein
LLGRLSAVGCAAQDADPLGKGDKFRQRLDLHFLHHPLAVGLDRALGCAQRVADLLVGLTANDKFEDFRAASMPRYEREPTSWFASNNKPKL